jgi:hypothetical protein
MGQISIRDVRFKIGHNAQAPLPGIDNFTAVDKKKDECTSN